MRLQQQRAEPQAAAPSGALRARDPEVARRAAPIERPTGDSMPAARGSVELLLNHLDDELDASGFYRSHNQRPMMQQNIRNIFTRADMTEQETQTLRGVISKLAAMRRRLSTPD